MLNSIEDLKRSEPSNAVPWVEKYRPKAMDDILAHEEIIVALRRLIEGGHLPHLLLHGPPGTGKTTTALACARMIYGDGNLRGTVLELNASDERGIDVVRNQIKDFAGTAQVFSTVSFKLIILDEADQMSNDAQAALRRVIEKYTRNVRFFLLCNHVNKIIPAVQSRCTRFRFCPLRKAQMLPRLGLILAREGIPHDDAGIQCAIRVSGGDMRRCLNILQGTSMSFQNVTEATVCSCTGVAPQGRIRELIETLVSTPFHEAYAVAVRVMTELGLSNVDLIRDVHLYVLRMDLPEMSKAFVLEALARVEHNASVGGSESVNRASLVAAFQILKEATVQGKEPASFYLVR